MRGSLHWAFLATVEESAGRGLGRLLHEECLFILGSAHTSPALAILYPLLTLTQPTHQATSRPLSTIKLHHLPEHTVGAGLQVSPAPWGSINARRIWLRGSPAEKSSPSLGPCLPSGLFSALHVRCPPFILHVLLCLLAEEEAGQAVSHLPQATVLVCAVSTDPKIATKAPQVSLPFSLSKLLSLKLP